MTQQPPASMADNSNDSQQDISLRPTLTALVLARLMLNGARRFPYVILTPMAQSIGVSRETLEAALSALWALGAISSFTGAFIDRVGRKRMMLAGIGLLGLFALLAAVAQNATLVIVAIIGGGLAKILFDPAMQAYIGDRTPYAKRGMAIGVTELSWSGSLFIFGPLAAFLIAQATLGAIYGVLAAGSIFAFLLIYKVIQPDLPVDGPRVSTLSALRSGYRLIFASKSALAILAVAMLISIGAESITIVYEEWLRNGFGMSTIALGSLSWILAIAEVSGEFFVIGISDRVGKRRLNIFAISATGVSYLLLSLFAVNSFLAVAGLFLLFLCFEISVVSLLPLATEAVPQARGTMMSINVAAFSAGRAVGTLAGGALYRAGGIPLNGLFAMVVAFFAAALIWRFVAEHRGEAFQPELLESLE